MKKAPTSRRSNFSFFKCFSSLLYCSYDLIENQFCVFYNDAKIYKRLI